MAKPTVLVNLKRPAGGQGGVHISISRWKQKGAVGDTISWQCTNPNDSDLDSFSVTWDHPTWPFDGQRRQLFGDKNTPAQAIVSTGGTVDGYYTVTFYFTDDDGFARTANVDPDMVIN